MRLEDGTGKGVEAAVSREFKLATTAVVASPQQHASGAYGKAFQAVSGIKTVTGAYGILALQNGSQDNLVITYIRVAVDKVETAQALVELNMGGTWVAGTEAPEPVNLNGRFALLSGVVSHFNAVPTTSSNIDSKWVKGPDEAVWRKEGSIILPANGVFSIKVTPETASVNVHARVSFIMLTDDELADL